MTTPIPEQAGRDVVRRIVSAVVVSALGTWGYNVGIAVYAYQETGSTAWVAIATVGRYVPAVLITWFGTRWLAHRPRRTVAVVCDIVCAVSMLALTVVAATHGPILLAIAIASVSSGVARIQASVALALAADVVPESMLVRTIAALNSGETIATAAGPALAALVLSISSPPALFLLNGVTFAVSAVLFRSLHVRTAPAPPTAAAEDRGRARALDREVLGVIWPLLGVRFTIAVLYGIDIVLLAVIATDQLRQQTVGYGWLLAATGAGGIASAVVLSRRASTPRTTPPVVLGMLLASVPLLVYLLSPALPGSLAVQFARGAGFVLVTTTVIVSLQWSVPSRASAPVFGLVHTLVLLGTSVGVVLAPLMLGAWGLDVTLVVAAAVPIVVLGVLLGGLRAFDRESSTILTRLDPRVATLRQLTLFHEASRATLLELADGLREAPIAAGDVVVRQGDESDALYVLVDGEVEVSADGPTGRQILRRMSAPTYFGEIGVVHRIPRTATVTAVAPGTVWRIPRESFTSAAGQAGLSTSLSETVQVRLGDDPASGARSAFA